MSVQGSSLVSMDKASHRFLLFLAILATPLAAGAFLLAWGAGNQYFDFAPMNDGYVAPRDIATVIDKTQQSTVTVYCRVTKNRGSQGTGWAINPSILQVQANNDLTKLMTNHHVIDDCIDGAGKVTVAKQFKKEVPAEILYYDKKNDLAVLETKISLKPIELSDSYLWPGYWVMSLGSAAGYEGSVSFGSVINVLNEDVLISNSISSGNSGGPLIDNEGNAVGIITWGSDNDDEQFNGARSLDTFCEKIVKCEFEYEGVKTWFDYSG